MLVTHRCTRVLACMTQGSFCHGAGRRIPSHSDQGIPVPYHASWSRCYNCVVTWNAIPVRHPRHPTYDSGINVHKSAVIHEFVSDHSLDVLALSETKYIDMRNTIPSDLMLYVTAFRLYWIPVSQSPTELTYGGGNSTSAEEVLQIPASLP